ncbi:MAG: type II toxin-antitoxin system RelE/ParE family toxin [Candidatus Methanofastidiosia archaeon]
MIYGVLLYPKAKIFLGKLDQEVRKRIKYKLEELERFPNKRGKHLHRKNVYDDHSRAF